MESWIADRRRLLALEQDEERRKLQEKLNKLTPQECQEEGISLLSVEEVESWTSLFGRTTILVRRQDKAVLPTHSFRVGDEVCLYSPRLQHTDAADSARCSGVVSKVTQNSIEVVTEPSDELHLVPPLRLDLSVSEATNKKLNSALTTLKSPTDTPGWPLMHIVFEQGSFDFPSQILISPINIGLNASQVSAVAKAIGSPRFSLIHGPPGTGKTTVITEVILQAVLRHQKLLVCAPSNVATDNLLEKLAEYAISPSAIVKPKMVRLGHPARVNPVIQRYCLDAAIHNDEAQEIIFGIRKEISGLRRAMTKSSANDEKRVMRGELKALSSDLRKREKNIVSEIIRTSDIVLCTTIGASSSLLRDITFDACVIDEAAQAIDVACWIPMLRSSKCIMAGDHCQLPPTIKSKAAEQGGLGDTLFQHLINRDVNKVCSSMLDTQYRMNSLINHWASREMYNGLLKSHIGNADHTLADLGARVSVAKLGEMGSSVLLLIDTTGCDMREGGGEEEGGSYRNVGEAKLVLQHIECLVKGGVAENEIGVITPYNAQVQLLKLMIRESEYPNVQVKTVDGFQGGEKEAIILSFVRSNDARSVGFLADKRRINVAVTRARRHLAVICDAETCSADDFLGRFVQYVSEFGEHRSAAELLADDVVTEVYSGPLATMSEVVASNVTGAVQDASASPALNNTVENDSGTKSSSSKKRDKKTKKNLLRSPEPRDRPEIAGIPPEVALKDVIPNAVTLEQKDCVRSYFKCLIEQFSCGQIIGGLVDAFTIINDNITEPSENILDCEKVKEWLAFASTGEKSVVVPAVGEFSINHGFPLVVFVINPMFSNCLEFPPSLTSFHRLLVHELCEEYSLRHKSIENTCGRHIEVYKPLMREDCTLTVNEGKLLSATSSVYEVLDDEEISTGIVAGDNSKNSCAVTEFTKPTSKPSKKSKKATASTTAKSAGEEFDEMAFLEAEIAKNKEYAEHRKYRVSTAAFPNPYKEDVRAKLVHTLADVQQSRRQGNTGGRGNQASAGVRQVTRTFTAATGIAQVQAGAPTSVKTQKTKQLKKPPRFFGGGKVGGESEDSDSKP